MDFCTFPNGNQRAQKADLLYSSSWCTLETNNPESSVAEEFNLLRSLRWHCAAVALDAAAAWRPQDKALECSWELWNPRLMDNMPTMASLVEGEVRLVLLLGIQTKGGQLLLANWLYSIHSTYSRSNCSAMLSLCRKLPPKTSEYLGVQTAWIQSVGTNMVLLCWMTHL